MLPYMWGSWQWSVGDCMLLGEHRSITSVPGKAVKLCVIFPVLLSLWGPRVNYTAEVHQSRLARM